MTRTDIDHYAGLTYWGPVSTEQMEEALQYVELEPDARALDIGCGRAEVLVRLVERFGLAVTGVDRSVAALELARDVFRERCPQYEPELIERDAVDLNYPPAHFDWISWLGGPYVGESFQSTVQACSGWLRPGGFLLLGHGFWAMPPPEPYLAATGLEADELVTHEENIEVCRGAGLELVHTSVGGRTAWDEFEGTILRNHERYAAAHPESEAAQKMIEKKRVWNEAQTRWGRDTMVFALYLLRKGASAPRR